MTKENHAGKGDKPRKVDGDAYRRNHESIFKKSVADVCQRCGDCDCMADRDFDSHDENLYKENL